MDPPKQHAVAHDTGLGDMSASQDEHVVDYRHCPPQAKDSLYKGQAYPLTLLMATQRNREVKYFT